MTVLGLETDIVDAGVYANSVTEFRKSGIRLPTFRELSDPSTIDPEITETAIHGELTDCSPGEFS